MPPPPGRFVTVAVLLLASLTIMANATISPALPGLRAHFAGVEGIDTLAATLVTAPSLAILLTAGLTGWLADRVNRQALLLASGLLYALGGTVGLWADDIMTLMAGRAVLGLGVAGTMTLAMTWGADLWQGEARARFLGRQGAAMSAGSIVVMMAGGILGTLHWRGPFAAYALVLPVVVLALIALAPHAKAQRRAAAMPRADKGERFPWRAYALVGPMAFVFMAVFYVVPTRGAFLMAERGVDSSIVIAAVMAAMTLTAIPGALFYGRVRRYLSAMSIFALSYVVMGLGLAILSRAEGPGAMLAGTLVMGLGMGPSMPNYTTWFMAFVPPGLRGRASGLLTTAFFAGQFAAPLLAAPLVGRLGLADTFAVLGLAMVGLGAVVWVAGATGRGAPVAG